MLKYTVTINEIFDSPEKFIDQDIVVNGWVRTTRGSKGLGFIELNDGSAFKNLQVVFTDKLNNYDDIEKASIGSSLAVKGKLVKSIGCNQSVEIQADEVEVIGFAELDNPIQKKRHTFEFLRTIPHLRSRTNTFMAVFRVRSLVAQAIHRFFAERKFTYIHAPIITASDCEGAGEMFRVSSLNYNNLPKDKDGFIDFSQELLGRESFLTVSGQLDVEPFCLGFRNVYTFGPTFRAENSNTARHANEFWMIEPEMAFADLSDDMGLAEALIKYLINDLLEKAPNEMAFFNQFVDEGLIERLKGIAAADFGRITYTEAIEILKKADVQFEFPVRWEDGLQSEHERYLAEVVFKKPLFVTDYPKEIKAFYMKLNADGKTVRAMDLLAPGIGEIIGGSQREENPEVLKQKIIDFKLDPKMYEAYMDTRRFGTFPHAGFGLGFERVIMYFTGMKNIRDVIPYPRTPNSL